MEKLRSSQKGKRQKKHGFMVRSKSAGGNKVLKRRRGKNRKSLAV